jgi:hypothetical protein
VVNKEKEKKEEEGLGARAQPVLCEIQFGNDPLWVVKREEEGLGVPPLGSGYPLQVLVGCALLRLLWAFRCYPSRGYAILGRRPSATPPSPQPCPP